MKQDNVMNHILLLIISRTIYLAHAVRCCHYKTVSVTVISLHWLVLVTLVSPAGGHWGTCPPLPLELAHVYQSGNFYLRITPVRSDRLLVNTTDSQSLSWLRRRFWHATHDCVAPSYVDIILHRGRFWAKSADSGSVRWCCFRFCWTVF